MAVNLTLIRKFENYLFYDESLKMQFLKRLIITKCDNNRQKLSDLLCKVPFTDLQ